MTDSTYESQINALNTRLNNQNLATNQSELLTKQQYGFDADYANDPYTKANMLARASQQRFTGSTNRYAAMGQLYSGSLSNQRGADEFQTGYERDVAMKEYAQALANFNQQRLESQSDYALGSAEAYGGLVDRLTSATPTPEPVAASGGDTSGGASGPSPDAIAKAQNILKNPEGKSKAAITWARQILGR
jgi:hypothetical protein